MGKTALLDAAEIAESTGQAVVRVATLEYEADLLAPPSERSQHECHHRPRPRRLRRRLRLARRLRPAARRRLSTYAVVQNPTMSLDGDVAATRTCSTTLDGPVVLVGHSYGGVVITEAGTHDKVAALVYIAAFAPDKGESVNTLIADPPPGAPVPPILPPRNGYLVPRPRQVPRLVRRRPPPTRPRSWPTPRCRGASTPSAARSPSRRGGSSRAGTWSPPTTG